MSRFLIALLMALAMLAPGTARAEERILTFSSDVEVGRDGVLTVAEAIRVRVEGTDIQHGIYRDFPTRYKGRLGKQVRVGFEVLDVQLDGEPVMWDRSNIGNGVRVRIGDPEVYVPVGEHVYTIRYKTSRQLGFFEDFDELYWNVTGNGWMFPIDVAEARIRLPEPTTFGQRAVYTGPQGSTASNATVVEERPGEILLRTTAPLGPYEGFTVAVAWPKGIIDPPAASQQTQWWLADNGPPGVAILGLLGILGYYFHAWRRAGRGPDAGTVVPIFSPPDNLSAAGMRYVSEMGSDNRTFAAALIELGVRGKLRLEEGEKPLFGLIGRPKTTIHRTGLAADLPPAEAAMMNAMFAAGDSLLMDDKNHQRFRTAQQSLANNLKRQFEGKLFVRNWSWSMRGLLALIIAIWLVAVTIILTDSPWGEGGPLLWPPIGSAAAFGIAAAIGARPTERRSGSAFLTKALGMFAAFVGILLAVATIGLVLNSGRILPLLIPLLSLPVVITAFWWMAAPTREGRQVLDRIAGFRHYLSITEEERLESLHPPEKTPELFERYLPYAIALEVENQWADRFAAVLAAASAAGQAHTMSWYSGHSDPWSNPGQFVDRMGSSLSSAVASASTAPGSSSGSGGGGSSGGGGGGGGGGGW